MIYDDEDEELSWREREEQRHKARFHSMAWEAALIFATIAATFVIGFLVVQWVVS